MFRNVSLNENRTNIKPSREIECKSSVEWNLLVYFKSVSNSKEKELNVQNVCELFLKLTFRSRWRCRMELMESARVRSNIYTIFWARVSCVSLMWWLWAHRVSIFSTHSKYTYALRRLVFTVILNLSLLAISTEHSLFSPSSKFYFSIFYARASDLCV